MSQGGHDWGQPPGSGGGGFGSPPGAGPAGSGFGSPPGAGPAGSGFGSPPPSAPPVVAHPMPMQAPPAQKSRGWIVIVAGLAVGGFCMISCILFGIFAGKNSQEQQALWSGLRSYDPCGGRGAPGAAEYQPSSPPPHRMAAHIDGSWPVNRLIPTALRAERASQTELVVCVGAEEEQRIETCRFHPETTVFGVGVGVGSETREVYREVVRRELRIVVARTGEVLFTTPVWGGAPRSCDDDVDWEELSTSGTTWRGLGPSDSTIETLVTRWSNGETIEPEVPPGLIEQSGRAVHE